MNAILRWGAVLIMACAGCQTDGADGDQTPAEVGQSRLRRLTQQEYNNTVRDLLGDQSALADDFVPDEVLAGFASNTTAPVSSLMLQQYQLAAETLAAAAVADLPSVMACDPSADPVGCATTFATDFGRRVYRRPLSSSELQAWLGVHAAGGGDFASGVENMIGAALQSPHFLYRPEFGVAAGPGNIVALTDYEIASRLSYFLWNSTPDDELLDAAEAGELSTPKEIGKQARRLLDDPRAMFSIANFHLQWLELGRPFDGLRKDETLFPTGDVDLLADTRVETALFADHVIRSGDGLLRTLLTSPRSFVNDRLAKLYGVDSPGSAALVLVDLDPTQRSGILTHASVLAVHAKRNQNSPVARGKLIRERLLCQTPPPPPPNVDTRPPSVDPSATTRERFQQHREDPACSGCHNLMDPIGFGFEHYDPLGTWRTEEAGRPVDASGEVFGAAAELNGRFVGVPELAARLADSGQVQQCLFDQWFTYALGHPPAPEDQASVEEAFSAFADADFHIPTLIVALTTTDAFRYRRIQ